MRFLLQRNWHTAVRLTGQDLISEVTYCGTDQEVYACLVVDPQTFIVKGATWEKYRTPTEKGQKTMNLTQLVGMEAYLGCGPTLRRLLAPLQDSFAQETFAETVRGLTQAETFLLQKRGYSSQKAYEDDWKEFYAGSCRFYSNLDQVTKGWYEYLGYHERRGILFNRLRNLVLAENGSGSEQFYLLTGQLCDSFHEVSVKLVVAKDDLSVKKATSHFLRVPDPICGEGAELVKLIEGQKLLSMPKRKLAHLLRSSDNCVHLIDLVYEAVVALEHWQKKGSSA
ncbi:MAG: DUF2889 domain-containing protein [Firmicutes bacterium]|nr:DUF2889 domain-containing protein [Bacillota bacterium]